MIFFSADLHMGHKNVIDFCNRPYKDLHSMNKGLIHNWNQRVKPEDTVFHIGDFCFKGGKIGGKSKAIFFEEQLNGRIIHIKGNHDKNNTVKTVLIEAVLEFGNKTVLAQHIAPVEYTPEYGRFDLILCGHVHEKWKHKWFTEKIPIINVGVDVWKYMPVRMDEILVYYDRIVKERK